MSAIALTLTAAGLFAGILAGFLGIGGGTVLVPILVSLQYAPVQAVATSSLSIVITALSGTIQNWRMGYLKLNQVLGIGLPAIVTAQFGAELATRFPPSGLLTAFGCLLLLNIYLMQIRKQVTRKKEQEEAQNEAGFIDQVSDSPEDAIALKIDSSELPFFKGDGRGIDDPMSDRTVDPSPGNDEVAEKSPTYLYLSRIFTGSLAGLLAGLFGVGGGIIMVPLQIVLLDTKIKPAIQTSLGVIVITAISSTIGHARLGNVLWLPGFILGFGGLIGAQISTRFLPKLPDKIVTFAFRTLLVILAIYIFGQAWQQYSAATGG
jgi:uncharacterized membrane protein YfcA